MLTRMLPARRAQTMTIAGVSYPLKSTSVDPTAGNSNECYSLADADGAGGFSFVEVSDPATDCTTGQPLWCRC